MRKYLLLGLLLAVSMSEARAQSLFRKVVFLGNSYTYANNMPLLVAQLAEAAGDSINFEMYAPGGYTLGWEPIDHATDPVSLALIAGNDWDFVVVQEQSQIPSIPILRDSCMLPGASTLLDAAKASDPCTQVLFFLTWGRRFGGMQCFTPNYCSVDFTSYNHMQDSVTVAYKTVADSLESPIAPAGEAWRFVINNYGMVLHEGDNSHPNMNGSYLTACVFYAAIYGKPVTGNTYTAGLIQDTALILQQAADSVVFGHASLWNAGIGDPEAAFSATTLSDTLFTENLSANATSWLWDFGDGNTSSLYEPVHVYAAAGTYTVMLTACNDCGCDSVSHPVTILHTSTGSSPAPPHPVIFYDPSAGTITLAGITSSGSYELYDLAGRRISTGRLVSGRCSVQGLKPGVYVFRADFDGKTIQGKISLF